MEKVCSICGNMKKMEDLYVCTTKDVEFNICLECHSNLSKKERNELETKIKKEMTEEEFEVFLKFVMEETSKTVLSMVSWNCNQGLKMKEYLGIMEYHPNILIVQECTKNDFDYIKNMWNYKNWYNDDLYTDKSEYGSNKGVAIFSNYKIEFNETFNPKYRYVIPYTVSKDKYSFDLFTVWIKPDNGNYRKPLYGAVEYYKKQNMLKNHSIMIGDFNTFAKNEIDLENLEKELSPLVNCSRNTRFRLSNTYYHGNDNYGIDDFCFMSEDMVNEFDIKLNIPNEWDEEKSKNYHWQGFSDHAPLFIRIKLK